MRIEPFFDTATSTLSYVVWDADSRDAVVIDPLLDFEPIVAETCTKSVERIGAFLRDNRLTLRMILETHAHADHLSGAQYLKSRHAAPVAIGAGICAVQKIFAAVYRLDSDFATDGSQFDRLLHDGEEVVLGALRFTVLSTPGHTPGCSSYRFGDCLFVGDAMFIEDYGTGRCDFPGGDADRLYTTIYEQLYALPGETRIFVGHDYQPGGRPLRYETTIAAQRASNVHLCQSTPRDTFVAFRRTRDATLSPPRLLHQSVQVNINAGRLPRLHENGLRYLIMPLNSRSQTGDDGTPLPKDGSRD